MNTTPPPTTHSAEFYGGKFYASEESVGYLIRQVFNSMQKHIDVRMQPHDLTAMQWGPLFFLFRGKGNTAAAMAREACTDTGAVTRMLDRLEAKTLIKRVRSEEDRRCVHLELTPEGAQVAAQIPFELAQVMNQHLVGFTPAEFEQLKNLLRRMIVNGQSTPAISTPPSSETP